MFSVRVTKLLVKRSSLIMMLVLAIATTAVAQKPGYVTGKLVDLRQYSEATRPVHGSATFCLSIQVRDISYLVDYEPGYGADHPPKELIVGDPIQVKIKGDNIWFIVGKHAPDKNPIVRRERIPPDGAPTTCAH